MLGIEWLEKFGMVSNNWQSQIMRFQLDSRTITLLGDPSISRSHIYLATLKRTGRDIVGIERHGRGEK